MEELKSKNGNYSRTWLINIYILVFLGEYCDNTG